MRLGVSHGSVMNLISDRCFLIRNRKMVGNNSIGFSCNGQQQQQMWQWRFRFRFRVVASVVGLNYECAMQFTGANKIQNASALRFEMDVVVN